MNFGGVRLLTRIREVDGSINDYIGNVQTAWSKAREDTPGWSYVMDVFDDYVVVSWHPESGGEHRIYRVSYTAAEDGSDVSFADEADWQELELSYKVKGEAGEADAEDDGVTDGEDEAAAEESAGMVRESFTAALESGRDGAGQPEAVIVVEGLSARGRHYTVEALRTGTSVFSGKLVYADHPSESEERDRPERSVRDIVGRLGEAYLGTDKAGRPALRAPLRLSETAGWLKTLIREGIVDAMSIRALGKGRRADDGTFLVEAFVDTPHTSVDFVTVASAGGYAEFKESRQGDALDLLDAAMLRRERPDLVEELAKESEDDQVVVRLREGEGVSDLVKLQAAHRKLEEDHQTLQEAHEKLFRQMRQREGEAFLEAQLKESRLPEATLIKLRAEGQRLIESYATHGSDETPDQLKAALSEAVEEEKKYLAQILPHGIVGGGIPETIGEASREEAEEADEELSEALSGLVPEGTLEVAIRGRYG
jgi:hypothetical protein